jgi:hypothetical protein
MGHAAESASSSTVRGLRIIRPERVSARVVWPNEAMDFTPWLAGHLDFLDDLGMGRLDVLGVEVQLPSLGRSLDILAQTADGHRVAIENQYHGLDHDHLTRGLAYAVGHEARALVVIAEEHRPEFVAVADYLNRCQEELGEEGIAVFLVEMAVERVDDAVVPRFSAVSRPNAWRAAVAVAGSGRLAGDEEFVAACEQTLQPPAGQILRHWRTLTGASVRYGKESVSLNLFNPRKSGDRTTSVFVLYTTGQLTVNRGYLIDSGLVPQVPLELLDEQLHQHFPAARWGEKSYYLAAPPPPDPDAIAALGAWVHEQSAGVPQQR